MGMVDTSKTLTREVPFYSVVRDNWGWVRGCVGPVKCRCRECIFKKRCFAPKNRR